MNARAADKDQYARDLRSLYRKSQFEEFGGREWQHILLALGDVKEEMVTIVNTIVRERTAASLLQQRGARVVPRGQRTQQEVPGINHRISEAKAVSAAHVHDELGKLEPFVGRPEGSGINKQLQR